MPFQREDAWVWDFWLAEHAGRHHLYYSHASRWYETLGDSSWPEETWRTRGCSATPPAAAGTRSSPAVPASDPKHAAALSNVPGSMTSTPGRRVRPLSAESTPFAHLEVPQLADIDGEQILIFSSTGGIWVVEDVTFPFAFPIDPAVPLTDEQLHSEVVVTPGGVHLLMAFENTTTDGRFVGRIFNPMPLTRCPDGNPTLSRPSAHTLRS